MLKILLLMFFFGVSIVSDAQDLVTARVEIIRIENSAEFKKERFAAVRGLTSAQKARLVEGLDYSQPIESIFLEREKTSDVCSVEDQKKLLARYPLRLHLALQSDLSMSRSLNNLEEFTSKLELNNRLSEMGIRGEFNQYPSLKKYYSYKKIIADEFHARNPEIRKKIAEKNLRMKTEDPEKKMREQERLADIQKTLASFGVKKSPKAFEADVLSIAPGCFGKGNSDFNSFLENERMYVEAKILVERLKEYYLNAGKIQPELSRLVGLDQNDPVIKLRDAWRSSYLLQKTDTQVILRSLGPDMMLSSDDVNLGMFNLKSKTQ